MERRKNNMNNSCILIGKVYERYMDEKQLIIRIKCSYNNKSLIIPVFAKFNNNDQIIDYLEIDSVIGIKGSIDLDNDSNIQIIAEKITFISSKNTDDDNNE